MRRQRRTKIVATLGPASSDPGTIERLFIAGADVFRINMSHTTHEGLRAFVRAIRGIEKKHGRPIGILADLQGPKLRLGTFAAGSAALARGFDRTGFFEIDTGEQKNWTVQLTEQGQTAPASPQPRQGSPGR